MEERGGGGASYEDLVNKIEVGKGGEGKNGGLS